MKSGSGGSLADDGALVEEELPVFVPEYPERGAVGGLEQGGGSIGGERHIVCELFHVEVMNGSRTRGVVEQDVDGLLTVVDAAGGAEFFVLFGKEGDQGIAVGLAVWVEEALFESVEMIL
jgi:hypothetical protein